MRLRALDEQGNRRHSREAADRSRRFDSRHRQWRKPKNVLTSDTQSDPAANQHLQLWGGIHEREHVAYCNVKVLERIENQQHVVVEQSPLQSLPKWFRPAFLDPKRAGDRRENERRLSQRTEIDEPHTVREYRTNCPCHLQGKPSLANAGWSSDRDEPRRMR
jgi:hypothetical protein